MRKINELPPRHPFELKYHKIERVDWESCSTVLSHIAVRETMQRGW